MSENTTPVVSESHMTPARRSKVVDIIKNRISKAKEKVRKEKDSLLRVAYEKLLKSPSKKVSALNKAYKAKGKAVVAADKAYTAWEKPLRMTANAAYRALDKKIAAWNRKFEADMRALEKAHDVIRKEFCKKTNAKAKILSASHKKNVREMDAISKKVEDLGYKIDLNEKSGVRPLFRTDDNGHRCLGGKLATEVREDYKARVEDLEAVCDNAELEIEVGGTSLEALAADVASDIDAIIS